MTWTAERYFTKAHSYWAHATNKERNSPEFLLYLTFIGEFVTRGAICFVNPALNAANDEDSILFSANVSPNKPPKTADISTVLGRLARLIPDITAAEINIIGALFTIRNSELHSDESALSGASQAQLVPTFFSYLTKVADFAQQDLAALLTKDDAQQARQTANAMLKDRKKRVVDLIKIQKDRFFGLSKDEQDSKRQISTPTFSTAIMTSGHRLKAAKCPSCAQLGYLGGSPVGRSAPILTEKGLYQETRIVPEVFECKCCDLKIKGLDELMAAEMGHEFQSLDEMDIVEHFNIDPMDYVDTDEIIREYQHQYEYQDE